MARIKKVVSNIESPFTRSQLNEKPSDTNLLKVKVETIVEVGDNRDRDGVS